jgi:hypothetical protein
MKALGLARTGPRRYERYLGLMPITTSQTIPRTEADAGAAGQVRRVGRLALERCVHILGRRCEGQLDTERRPASSSAT